MKSLFDLKGQVIVITGGAGRIGREFTKAVAQHNGIAIIADIDKTIGNEVKKSLSKELNTKNIDFVKLDISSKKSIDKVIKYLKTKYKRIDALVNNAYPITKNFGKKFFDISYDDFCDFTNLHLGGYFNTSQNFIKYFLNQGCGNIINISSIQGIGAPAFETYEGTNMHSPIEYTAAKTGLIGMTKYMAKMFKKDNIRVNTICPGGILDNQPEIFLKQYKKRCGTKGMLDAKDLSSALVFLLSSNSKYVNGQSVVIDDGFSL